MSKADEFARSVIELFSDGRTKKCKEANKKYVELVSSATDEELQEIAEKTGGEFEELKDRRRRFKNTLAKTDSR